MPDPKAVLLDLDGTLWEEGEPIPGAVETVARLREDGRIVRFLTNITGRTRATLARDLQAMGFEADPGELWTAASATARYLAGEGIRRIHLLAPAGVLGEFAGFEIDEANPEAIVAGDLGEAWSFEVLQSAFEQLLGGSRLLAMNRNRAWRNEGRLQLDTGAFVAALEFAAGVEATVLGKPSPEFFETVLEEIGAAPAEALMVGDDADADVGGARRSGLDAVLLRTGKFRPGDETRGGRPPVAVLDSIADLPGWLSGA